MPSENTIKSTVSGCFTVNRSCKLCRSIFNILVFYRPPSHDSLVAGFFFNVYKLFTHHINNDWQKQAPDSMMTFLGNLEPSKEQKNKIKNTWSYIFV